MTGRHAASLMLQGCGSDVGKSTLVAGLCRLFTNRGLAVRPFKPQNMSNNAAVTEDGGEIGRAQALQAVACRVPASVHMNPVLLKPQSDTGAQLIVRGKVEGTWQARGYQERKRALLDTVVDSWRVLQGQADLVLIEGAGSPAETNLRAGDIANMGFAHAADVPVVLVGDIDRGHVIAALVGAFAVLDEADRSRIHGFLINKFRGDPSLFDEGRRTIAERTGWADLGMAPFLPVALRLPSEDSIVHGNHGTAAGRRAKIVVPILSRIANADEFDPLRAEPSVDFSFIRPGTAFPGDADLVLLPGSKSTIADLAFFRAQGWDIDLAAHVRRGGRVFGICGGYQMLGQSISDPEGIEGTPGSAAGLGLLQVDTVLGGGGKILAQASGRLAGSEAEFSGYEIHVGRTTGPGTARPFLRLDPDGTADGAVSPDGRIAGAYVHGLFERGTARAAFLAPLGIGGGGADHSVAVDAALDELAVALERSLDIPALERIARR